MKSKIKTFIIKKEIIFKYLNFDTKLKKFKLIKIKTKIILIHVNENNKKYFNISFFYSDKN